MLKYLQNIFGKGVLVVQNKEFYEKTKQYIESLTKDELINFINNIIRKIPQSKFEEVLFLINSN